jgi:phosphatidylglycerol:prolipoprotein diacylglycerol transferase
MHPILFRIPLPSWTLPLFPSLLVLSVFGVGLAGFGWRKKALDLLVFGALLAVGSIFGALSFRGQRYTLSSLPIYSYGAMLCVSLIVGWYLTLGLAERDGLPRETMANCYFLTAIAALVGARVLYVVTNLGEFQTLSDVLALRRGGLVAYGGFLGGLLGSFVYLRGQRLPLLPWADAAVPSLASGLFFTRIGCYLFGCDFGKPLSSSSPAWLRALGTFPRWEDSTLGEGSGSPAWAQQVHDGLISATAQSSLPVHPTQLYESLVGAALLGLVFFVRRHRRFHGQVFFAFAFAYGALRFFLETVRDDAERGFYGPKLSEHLFLPFLWLLLGIAAILGPARSIANVALRRLVQALFVLPAFAVYLALRPHAFSTPTSIQLSTSQWIGFLTALAAAGGWFLALRRGWVLVPALSLSAGPTDAGAPPAPRRRRRASRERRVTSSASPQAKRRQNSDVDPEVK